MKSQNRAEKILNKILDNKIISVIVVAGTIIVAFGTFTDALESIIGLLFKNDNVATYESPNTPKTELNTVRATGVGFPPPNISNSAQRHFAVKRAAEADAMQKLAKSIYGSMVKSKTEIKDGKLSKDEIEIQVIAVLKSARIISEKEFDDGSYAVIMEAPLSQ